MCDLGFYEGKEGLLGDGKYLPEVLVILREPNFHSEREDSKQQDFWFRDAVHEDAPNGTRYRNIYKILVGKLFGIRDDDARLEKLKQCAYMNLRPDGGESQRSKGYDNVLNAFQELSLEQEYKSSIAYEEIDCNRKELAKEVAENRMRIIQNAIGQKVKYIVTTPDIYAAIVKAGGANVKKTGRYELIVVNKRGNKPKYHYCQMDNTIVFSFPHPSWTHISYEGLEKLDEYEGNDLFKTSI